MNKTLVPEDNMRTKNIGKTLLAAFGITLILVFGGFIPVFAQDELPSCN